MAALVFGLVTFTAAFIAEIVRAGVLAVPVGQSEAAGALGLHRGLSMRLVVIPQAMRLITPPLTSQYLNIVKNSSLAVFIGYPDLVQIFAGTVLNQTQAAVQVMAITMAVYLIISLAVALALNAFNARYALEGTVSLDLPAYVREAPEPEEPPPMLSSGALAWAQNQSLLVDRIDLGHYWLRCACRIFAAAIGRLGDDARHLERERWRRLPPASRWRLLGVCHREVGLLAIRVVSCRRTLAGRCGGGDRRRSDNLVAVD